MTTKREEEEQTAKRAAAVARGESQNNGGGTPGRMPDRKMPELKAVAQMMLERRGEPPYTAETCEAYGKLLTGELDLICDFMVHWRPLLKVPEASEHVHGEGSQTLVAPPKLVGGVDVPARWKEVQLLADSIAHADVSPTEVESALCFAVSRCNDLEKALNEMIPKEGA